MISRALKGRRKKGQGTINGDSKAISEQPQGVAGHSSEVLVVAASTSAAENGPTVEQPPAKPNLQVQAVAESETSTPIAKAENPVSGTVIKRSLLEQDNGTTAVETLATTDQDQDFES